MSRWKKKYCDAAGARRLISAHPWRRTTEPADSTALARSRCFSSADLHTAQFGKTLAHRGVSSVRFSTRRIECSRCRCRQTPLAAVSRSPLSHTARDADLRSSSTTTSALDIHVPGPHDATRPAPMTQTVSVVQLKPETLEAFLSYIRRSRSGDGSRPWMEALRSCGRTRTLTGPVASAMEVFWRNSGRAIRRCGFRTD